MYLRKEREAYKSVLKYINNRLNNNIFCLGMMKQRSQSFPEEINMQAIYQFHRKLVIILLVIFLLYVNDHVC